MVCLTMGKPTISEEGRVAKTLEAHHRGHDSTSIDAMATNLIESYGYASARRIARNVTGDLDYWERVSIVIEQKIREDA